METLSHSCVTRCDTRGHVTISLWAKMAHYLSGKGDWSNQRIKYHHSWQLTNGSKWHSCASRRTRLRLIIHWKHRGITILPKCVRYSFYIAMETRLLTILCTETPQLHLVCFILGLLLQTARSVRETKSSCFVLLWTTICLSASCFLFGVLPWSQLVFLLAGTRPCGQRQLANWGQVANHLVQFAELCAYLQQLPRVGRQILHISPARLLQHVLPFR